jgi:hypothetical protein
MILDRWFDRFGGGDSQSFEAQLNDNICVASRGSPAIVVLTLQLQIQPEQRMTLFSLFRASFLGILLVTTPAWGVGHGGSHGGTHSSSRSSGSRPYYGGGKHTTSHGGSYGTGGSSHKGGHYTSATGSHHYGQHK